MKIKRFLVGMLLLGAAGAQAGVTNIAQVPLLNIAGTGTVKPNLMLVYDDSGSMANNYTPDALGSAICRGSGSLAGTGATACTAGHPPFNTADFNKQYYNPAMRYTPAVKSDGTPYVLSDYGIASPWKSVRNDAFSGSGTTDLTSGFPDLRWCSDALKTDCRDNDATYTYPNATYIYALAKNTNPYYYTIRVSEFCTDANMTNCTSAPVGSPAPAGYPVPAKVRWCTTTALDTTTCQAKLDATHTKPRFAAGSAGTVSFGTITIGSSTGTGAVAIGSVRVTGGGSTSIIADGPITAPSGTSTTTNLRTFATTVAKAINDKTGLTNQYAACVKTPTPAGAVKSCAQYGVTVAGDGVVGVIPLECDPGITSKAACDVMTSTERANWTIDITATPVEPATTMLNLTGAPGKPFTLASLKLGSANLLPATGMTLSGNNNTAETAAAIVAAVNASSVKPATVKAYVGGNSVSAACAAKDDKSVCLIDSSITANGTNATVGTMTKQGSLAIAPVAGVSGVGSVAVSATKLLGGDDIFIRTDIVSGNTYPKTVDRTDCAGSVCTYDEEMRNFAIWYSFYRTRNQMMKTAVGQAFAGVTDKYRVGLARMASAASSSSITLTPNTFTGTQRTNFYSYLYGTSVGGSTPLRAALHNVGMMFKKNVNKAIVTELCQPNFVLVTTDGYWNGSAAADVVNNDNVDNPDRFCTKASGCTDSTSETAETGNSLADVALYWYNGGSNTGTVSLTKDGANSPGDLKEDMNKPGQVPGKDEDNRHLHINTYTLGLGVDGLMTYNRNYETTDSDFTKIKNGASGCPWNNLGTYVWPDPKINSTSDQQTRVDDLWHAAVNGRGKYFSASVPSDVVSGVNDALNNMQSKQGAAAAAATSTPNISAEDNDIFSDTFTTVKWYGELSKRKIDTYTGEVKAAVEWTSSATLGTQVAATSDTRKIYMYDASATNKLKDFSFGVMSGTEKAWFDTQCTALAQCTILTAEQKLIVNSGDNLVNWLRGQQTYANDVLFRAYSSYVPSGGGSAVPIVLGDIVSSKPAYLRDPRKNYPGSYQAYKLAQKTRKPMVYTAANDGMLHAFDAGNGSEVWAYVPRFSMKKMAGLASTGYATNHKFIADGAPDLADVEIGGAWRSVLVAGMGAGGRGYYALDVTDPANPKALWELCADAILCTNNSPNIGLTFGNAQFGKFNGKWVVLLTSGYNNVPGTDGLNVGDGKGHLFMVDIATGEILSDTVTNGDTATPSGLAKITAISKAPQTDPVLTYAFGGDNQGQMWRFDMTSGTAVVGAIMGDAGSTKPITTRPDVSICIITTTVAGVAKKVGRRVVLFGTGRLLDLPDTTNEDVQTLFLLKDEDGPRLKVGNLFGTTMVKQVLAATGTKGDYVISQNKVNLATDDGWYLHWDLNKRERMTLDPKIISGGANFVTNIPGESSACSVGGTSNVYSVSLCTGQMPKATDLAGGVLSPTSAAVGFIIVKLPNGQLKMIATLADGSFKNKDVAPFTSVGGRKVGWRRVRN